MAESRHRPHAQSEVAAVEPRLLGAKPSPPPPAAPAAPAGPPALRRAPGPHCPSHDRGRLSLPVRPSGLPGQQQRGDVVDPRGEFRSSPLRRDGPPGPCGGSRATTLRHRLKPRCEPLVAPCAAIQRPRWGAKTTQLSPSPAPLVLQRPVWPSATTFWMFCYNAVTVSLSFQQRGPPGGPLALVPATQDVPQKNQPLREYLLSTRQGLHPAPLSSASGAPRLCAEPLFGGGAAPGGLVRAPLHPVCHQPLRRLPWGAANLTGHGNRRK